MVLGLHVQEISLLQAAVTHHWDQFAAYQQWIHSLFPLVSDNQSNSVTSQYCLVTSIERIRQSIPEDVRECLHEFHQLEQPWHAQQVAVHAAKGLHKLGKGFDQERAATSAIIAKLQTQVNELSASKADVPPSSPSNKLADREQRLWDAIQALRASTCSQDCPCCAFCFTAPQLSEIIGHRTFARVKSYVRI
ncbi:hypothetical protein DSO57_1006392 [Entomophthora muscae]|uniref:Uncharacterized protein n=1 Tax=Entomophthora muscae TaxID=34485 RepID=A0ACC2TIS8_9FUNG|nr:hypothetical protein DSO57_1006392 [Entomophthora muscae]